ncbi:MAG: hypothetical protein COT39_01140 [Parcubacteria group bacterium CG08_land_8_20_14_0_20_48_21]|nr:MAG: hypothetical protein AUK21_02025 [Parcubacteria group bacterium CG2_30_48_51]PIS33060.1 MAG: hypothetical protein COT39_01140 [Parcubacteria group bacterium CG08_land_8_20_14_0_20_48_21]PIW79200.1 MAG: hypothetical protein COZ99_02125 [Parcubacteria group bacterium CG_4_8_14_3_um_filter_48_16]PIY77870.1 MAG: hypothetical protein COY83_02960 [Parcubacteria group bacterium CG_4_10_14_0_8_um_filter_48_154]PIZ77321.1 MAG: hypothetical protein COY03_03260 [bacterium CG_4_10_14_0_2_um_filter_
MPKIFVYDKFAPQDTAMMQALYSRSAQSVEVHAQKVQEAGSGKFMERFYVGYGHLSIADCGSTTIFIEGVSTLVAKAVQDWPLYAGQETSTRYIDMSQQAITDPVGTKNSKAILDTWVAFYLGSQEAVRAHIREKYPRKDGEDIKVYERAINARSFDILRGFLPAGIMTQLSWHTNLRQAWDKLAILRHHPLTEVREVAAEIHTQLKEKYAHSFSHELYADQEQYRDTVARRYNYFNPEQYPDFALHTTIDAHALEQYRDITTMRPPHVGLPHFLTELGQCTFDFLLDFGSFRDIQRHRNGVCRMPLLTTRFGFHPWYVEQLPVAARKEAENLVVQQKEAVEQLHADENEAQYYHAMGYRVPCRVTYGLPPMVYVIELRSGKTVHPTLRTVAHQMHHALKQQFPKLVIHADTDPDDWDVRRGLQDIKEKGSK